MAFALAFGSIKVVVIFVVAFARFHSNEDASRERRDQDDDDDEKTDECHLKGNTCCRREALKIIVKFVNNETLKRQIKYTFSHVDARSLAAKVLLPFDLRLCTVSLILITCM